MYLFTNGRSDKRVNGRDSLLYKQSCLVGKETNDDLRSDVVDEVCLSNIN